MSADDPADLQLRRMTEHDEPAVIDLLVACLDWEPGGRFVDFFRWKHEANPFGRSPGWVAVDGDVIVGFRTFLRWEFATSTGTVRAVRAVDTATHPEHRGRGIFRRLTERAITELTQEGVSFVFNTPNANSLPGYLKMGWRRAGQLPVLFRPTSLRALPRLAQARVPAELWSSPCEAGLSAADLLADTRPLEDLLNRRSAPVELRTRVTGSYLRWRYGHAPLGYRAVTAPSGATEGVAFFRLRRRGAAMEVAVGDIIVPEGQAPLARVLLKRIQHVSGMADHLIRLGDDGAPVAGFLPLPRRGPQLTYRPLADTAPGPRSLRLSLGDVELF